MIAEAQGQKSWLSVADATGQSQRFLSVYQAYKSAAKDITLQRLYIDTMQDILSKTPSVVLDDKLKGIVPYLPLDNATLPRPTGSAPTQSTQGGPGQAASGQSATGQSATGQSATGQSATGQSATGQSATGQSATGQSASGQGGSR